MIRTFALSILIFSLPIQSYSPLSLRSFFESIYRCNSWINKNTRSGSGSDLPETPIIRAQVPALLQDLGIRSVLDAGCGEFYWLKEVSLDFLESYHGVDIVSKIISNNQTRYGSSKITFSVADITCDELGQYDLILCRDVLQHLSDANVKLAINNIKKSKSRYLLTSTFPEKQSNCDPDTQESPVLSLIAGEGRNFAIAPFNFPAPLACIKEGFNGKVLALWIIEQLPDFEIF